MLLIDKEIMDTAKTRRAFKADLIENLQMLCADNVELVFMRLKERNQTYQWHLTVRLENDTEPFVLCAEYPTTQRRFGVKTLKNLAARVLIWRDTYDDS